MSDRDNRVGRGSLTGRWRPRPGACPNIRGGITIERDLPANTKLWLNGLDEDDLRGEYVSLLVEIADKDGRPHLVILFGLADRQAHASWRFRRHRRRGLSVAFH